MSKFVLRLVAILCLAPLIAQAQGRIDNEFDKFGNPVGKEYSLSADGEFKGKKLLACTTCGEVNQSIFAQQNPLWKALGAKGFDVELKYGRFQADWLKSAAQLWLFCDRGSPLPEADVAAIEAFVRHGKGLYIIADNAPYLVEANQLCPRLFNVNLAGDYQGTKTIAIRGKGMTSQDFAKGGSRLAAKQFGGRGPGGNTSNGQRSDIAGRIQSIQNSSHYVDDHLLLTGIHFIYEGITISHIEKNSALDTVLVASDGQILSAVARDPKLRVVVDCGFTRYYTEHVENTAGTVRYAENIAAYLMGRGANKPVAKQSIAELLGTMDAGESAQRKSAQTELGRRSPKYSEVKTELAEIRAKLAAQNPAVVAAARAQLANAFVRAPIADCLHWLGQADRELDSIIWEQIDARIARADDERKISYREAGLARLVDSSAPASERRAALELLSRLKDRRAAGPVIDALIELPRELQAPAGLLLKELTGQSFGPATGDGIAEAFVAAKKWKTWWQEHGSEP